MEGNNSEIKGLTSSSRLTNSLWEAAAWTLSRATLLPNSTIPWFLRYYPKVNQNRRVNNPRENIIVIPLVAKTSAVPMWCQAWAASLASRKTQAFISQHRPLLVGSLKIIMASQLSRSISRLTNTASRRRRMPSRRSRIPQITSRMNPWATIQKKQTRAQTAKKRSTLTRTSRGILTADTTPAVKASPSTPISRCQLTTFNWFPNQSHKSNL